MSAHLSVAITTAGGTVYRWGPDEWDSRNIPQGISFGSTMPGGFKSATITLPRRIDQEYVDLNLLDNVEILGPGNEVYWEGRVQQLPRSFQDTFSITVGCVGWSAHLLDNPAFREVYIDADLSNWGEPATSRKQALLAGGLLLSQCQASQGWGATPALLIQILGHVASHASIYEWTYSSRGVDLGEAICDTIVPKASGEPGGVGQILGLCSNEETGGTVDISLPNTAATQESISAGGAGKKFAFYQLQFSGAATGTFTGDTYGISNVRVLGNHGLTQHGTWPNIGLYASDVIANVISRAAPLLKTSIQATTFAIPHLVFNEPTGAEDVIKLVNGYHLWDWGVWEEREFVYQEPDSENPWVARLSDGAKLDLEGSQVSNVYNGVFVSYTDPGGQTHSVGPIGSGADVESAELEDTSATNPVNAHGIPKKWALLSISQTTTEAAAKQLGRIYLGEKSLPQRQGTLTLTGTVTHPTEGQRPAAVVRAGDWIRIADHPTDVPRKIIEATYAADTETVSLSLDNTSQKLDAILERLGVSLTGVL